MTFTFFYGPESPFSNWYMMPFVHNGHQYNCSEQYMMYQKAMLFHDYDVADMIMEQSHPRKQKFLGREVRNFDNEVWMENCEDIMVDGLYSKFTQDSYSLITMIDSGDSIIVEASPTDKIWGIGMDVNHPDINDPNKWKGMNLLGKVLMRTREKINDPTK